MTGPVRITVTAAAFVLAAVTGVSAGVVDVRIDDMKEMSQSLKRAALAANAGDAGAAAAPTATVLTLVERIPTRFPVGSAGSGTGARASVWSDPAGFRAATEATVSAARNLAAAAAAGDLAATRDLLEKTGSACAACHRTYRTKPM